MTAVRRPGLRLGLKLAQGAPIDSYRQVWRIADEGGLDHCWAFDHLVSLTADGASRPLFEGWSLLGAMAEATKRVGIGLLVGGLSYRHPALVAKAAATVDHVSDGRLQFGVGAGYAQTETEMLGLVPETRPVARFDEAIRVIERLWTEERVDFSGEFFRLEGAVADPKPLQQPHPPIWIGANGPRMLRLAARHADVWNPADGEFDAARRASGELVSECEEIGRDPSELRWSTQVPFLGTEAEPVLEKLAAWWEAGFSDLVVYLTGPDPVASADIVATAIAPALRKHCR